MGQEGDVEYLVMEYLEGETLADRLLKGPLPLEQTLRFGIEIADALDKAHRQGIVHRDLKPGNVMLTKSGVKLLDFGLAKAVAPASQKSSLTALPTQHEPDAGGDDPGDVPVHGAGAAGGEGGRRADGHLRVRRACSTRWRPGKKAFSGTSQASLISSIMRDEPAPISQVQPMTPPALDRVVRTCLAKDPDDRWQNARDLGGELKWIAEGGSQTGATAISAVGRRSRPGLPWAVAVLATLVAAGIAFTSRRPPQAVTEPILLTILPPQRTLLTDSFEISPDGRKLVFGGIAGGKLMLRVRDLDSDEVRALPGTETAESPFWSPDGRFLVFFSRAKLRRIELSTGSVEVLGDAELGRGGSWGSNGDILFTPKSIGTIYRISAAGGQPEPATRLEPGEVLHRWPYMLPDGRRFLVFVRTDKAESTGIYLASLDKPGHKLLVKNGATGLFLAPDILLFVRGEALLAQRLDLDRGELRGDPETVTRPVMRADVAFYRDLFSVSREGIVVFRPGSASRRLVWMDRRGTLLKAVGPTGAIMNVSLSPDNRTAGFTLRQVETGTASVWTLDLARDVATPFAETGWMPIFTPDGNSILYRSEGATFDLRRRSLKDGREETIVADNFATPYDVTADGHYVLYNRTKANADIGIASLTGDAKPQLLLTTEYEERNPSFSPDGHWFAYSSSEPGQHEVFVRRLPMTDEKWAISNGGGLQPLWSRDGKEIYYATLDGRLMAAPVSAGATFSLGTPKPLFQTSLRLNNTSRQYAASADGQRFLMVVPAQDVDSENFRVMLNWRRPGPQ